MINTLNRGPSDFVELLKYYFPADPRVVKRPIEALHFAVMFKLFGLKPLGYHWFNLILEIVSSWLLYFCLKRITGNSCVALLTSILFLLYPSHNSTHYWVVCSSVSLSMVFYLGSLLADIEAVLKNRPFFHLLSGFLFLLSLLNYEVLLPLATINVFVVWFLRRARHEDATRYTAMCIGCLGAALVLEMLFLRFLVPLLAEAWMQQVTLDARLMISTLKDGIALNLPWISIGFFNDQAAAAWEQGISPISWALLAFAEGTAIVALCSLYRMQKLSGEVAEATLSPFWLFVIGIAAVCFSYTIFGLNNSYGPTFATLVNRVNAGATVGLSFIMCGILVQGIDQIKVVRNRLLFPCLMVLPLFLVAYFILTNWALARPYILSWQVQSQIANRVQEQAELLKEARSLLLTNVPRYVNEAPVFDGVWDFQNMIRLKLARNDIKGGVIGDRYCFASDRVLDAPGGLVLATYELDGLYLMFSPEGAIRKVTSVEELLELVSDKGMQFEPDKTLPVKWRKQLEEHKGGSSGEQIENSIINNTFN